MSEPRTVRVEFDGETHYLRPGEHQVITAHRSPIRVSALPDGDVFYKVTQNELKIIETMLAACDHDMPCLMANIRNRVVLTPESLLKVDLVPWRNRALEKWEPMLGEAPDIGVLIHRAIPDDGQWHDIVVTAKRSGDTSTIDNIIEWDNRTS